MNEEKPRQGLDGDPDDPIGLCVVLRGSVHVEVCRRVSGTGCFECVGYDICIGTSGARALYVLAPEGCVSTPSPVRSCHQVL